MVKALILKVEGALDTQPFRPTPEVVEGPIPATALIYVATVLCNEQEGVIMQKSTAKRPHPQ